MYKSYKTVKTRGGPCAGGAFGPTLPALLAEAEQIVSRYRLGPLLTPASLLEAEDGTRGTLSLPGSLGGSNREGGAADPENGFLYVASSTNPYVPALAHEPEASDVRYIDAGDWTRGPQRLPLPQ